MVTPLGEQRSRGGGKKYFQFFVVHFATEPTITSFCKTTNDTVGGIVERAGELAGLLSPVHAHMLWHGTGYYLANRGTDTRTIQSGSLWIPGIWSSGGSQEGIIPTLTRFEN